MKNPAVHLTLHTVFLSLMCLAMPALAEPRLNGLAMHSKLGQDQFIAAVYCETLTDSADELLNQSGDQIMEMRVAADQLYPRRFKRMWVESMAINSSSSVLEQHAQNMADFANLLKVRLRAGDIVRIEKLSGQGVRVLVDGHELGMINDPEFFPLLLRTWVGPVPLSTSFKNALLAKGEVEPEISGVYYSTVPDPQRVEAIGEALAQQAGDEGSNRVATATSSRTTANNAASTAAAAAAATVAATASSATPAAPAASAPAAASSEPATPAVTEPETDTATPAETTAEAAAPVQVASANTGLLSEDDLFGDDSILDEDDDETITAESLLSEQLYISKLTRWTSGFVEYPRTALRRNQTGTVLLLVTINRAGQVVNLEYAEESEHRTLNKAAYEAVEKASPFPAIPASIQRDTYSFNVPVVFRLE